MEKIARQICTSHRCSWLFNKEDKNNEIKRTNNERDTNKDPLSQEKLILETWNRFSLKNTSNLAMEMIDKVDVGSTTRKTFIFDQIVFKERFHGVTLLHDE